MGIWRGSQNTWYKKQTVTLRSCKFVKLPYDLLVFDHQKQILCFGDQDKCFSGQDNCYHENVWCFWRESAIAFFQLTAFSTMQSQRQRRRGAPLLTKSRICHRLRKRRRRLRAKTSMAKCEHHRPSFALPDLKYIAFVRLPDHALFFVCMEPCCGS